MKRKSNLRLPLVFGIIAAVLLLTFVLAPNRFAQTRDQQQKPAYKFTVRRASGNTRIAVKARDGKIAGVSGTNDRGVFKFKALRAGTKPTIAGRRGQVLKCATLLGLKPSDNIHWTFCFYVDGGSGSEAASSDYLLEIDDIRGETGGDSGGGGGGGGGGGAPSNCWEDEELQMSICDP